MITKKNFDRIVGLLGEQAEADISWANRCCAPPDAEDFALETIYVICNSGMKHAVAVLIYNRIRVLLNEGKPVKGNVLGKSGKAAAIDKIWTERVRFYAEYMAAPDKVAYARTIPWIGGITCYHVAKNFGAQVAKPDVHLKRLADLEGVTAQELCERLARETGHKVPAIDTVLWRACATGIMNSKTGAINA